MKDFSELKHPAHAVKYLSQNLKDGTLTLFLGAGTSKGFGLPSWLELVNLMREHVGLASLDKTATADELQHGADEVKDKLGDEKQLIELVSKYLYPNPAELIDSNIFDNHLLVSMSALLMGSKRGHVSRVVTLNYDNMLEWFLTIFGFVVKTIYELPALEGSEDVRIYHPHGFIPHPETEGKRSDFIILGMQSANIRLGTPGDQWFEMVRHLLNTSVCLFVGMSGNSLSDRALAPLFSTSGKLLEDARPLGIWISKEEVDSRKDAEFQRNNIIPIVITEAKRISEFLLKICQEAIK